MATQEQIIEALKAMEARLNVLEGKILAGAERPLPEGTWKVWDALCHLAARSNPVAAVVARAERAKRGESPWGNEPRQPVNDVNQSQIDARRGRSAAELLSEIHAGHQTAIEQVATLDGSLLTIRMPNFRGEEMEASDMLMGGMGHDNGHLDQIERALD